MHDSLPKRWFMAVTTRLDQRFSWDKLPKPIAILVLVGLRMSLRRQNLYDTTDVVVGWGPELSFPPDRSMVRSVDGSGTDPIRPQMGASETRFGRNVPIGDTRPPRDVLTPNPRVISNELLARRTMVEATTLNLLVAPWIQFEVHDWMSHGDNERTDPFVVDLAEGDPFPQRPMRIPRTRRDPTATDDGGPPTYLNTETHWWDASQVYGSVPEVANLLRAGSGGHLKLDAKGMIPFDPPSMDDKQFPGVNLGAVKGNWWLGLAMLHSLFMQEHNAICDRLAEAYPTKTDDELYELGRLINAALIARIHTLEWTPALLADTDLDTGMKINWWGVQGETLRRHFGRLTKSEELSGIPGSELYYHGVPFSMTEEFLAIYRMHPLVRDDYTLRSASTGDVVRECALLDIAGVHTRDVLATDLTLDDYFYSFGRSHPGALRLHNYPNQLRQFPHPDGTILDLAAVDILRDRERGVPSYNEFRRLFRMGPARSFADFSEDPSVEAELRRIYATPDDVDLMVGCLAEECPPGFAISDTAFRVFILMASRRLKSDRFFTTDYNDSVYTEVGMDWIEDNTMVKVLRRHLPQLTPALEGVTNAFKPWNPIEKH
jgi:Animal haem peroxidase